MLTIDFFRKINLQKNIIFGSFFYLSISAYAEDIDIFTSVGSGNASSSNIVFLVDNSANWARQAQQWPDGDNQGESELLAIKNVVNSIDNNTPVNIGLAMYGQNGNIYSGYLRFGARNITATENKVALSNILDGIRSNVNHKLEKVASNDGEAVALYEIYKYFNNQIPYRGNSDPNRDISGNTGGNSPYTTTGQNLTSGFAISNGKYSSPVGIDSCGRSYVVLIANNSNGTYPSGSQAYEGKSAGNPIPGTNGSWTDEWARFLYQAGISVYVLDAYNKQNNSEYSKVLKSAALNGGGKYFQVGSQADIESALKQIMVEIKSVNSSFASASLPISATNRAQNLNEVFIGMFRPDGDSKPRWPGNLKRYQLINNGSAIDLGDALGKSAINLQTGFVDDCAVSYWTTDSFSYWEDVRTNPLASSECAIFPNVNGAQGSKWSDLPDGPRVEKGGVAEIIRKGNRPPTTNTTPTWAVNRKIKTHSRNSTVLDDLSITSTGLTNQEIINWIKGQDNLPQEDREKISNSITNVRPSIHGDVIHSKPLPINYGNSNGVVVYYGANDGIFRAVKAENGEEIWAFVAPEFLSKFQRLRDQSPLVKYPNTPSGIIPTPKPKDYGFDGSTGIYQNSDNSKIWIYPTMRRGGRMVYAFDVTNPENPTLKWRKGCPELNSDTDCSNGFSSIGQTWSTPNVAFLKGYSSTKPVLIFGGGYAGGYDNNGNSLCEDINGTSPNCATRKGNVVYVLDADTGEIIKSFTHSDMGSIAADISLADTNNDGSVDYAYAVDTKGNIYRIDFSSNTQTLSPENTENWGIRKVAYTDGSHRKFLFAPALLNSGRKMYVALGSGDREHPLSSQYPYERRVQNRFFVYLDDLNIAARESSATPINLDSNDLEDFTNPTGSTCETTGITPDSDLKGWFIDLDAGRGEQTVTSALIVSGLVTFNTNRPTPGSTNMCTSPLGEARGYWLNILNASGGIGANNASCGGDRSSIFVGGGFTPSPTMATVAIDGKTTTVVVGAVQLSGGASSSIAPQRIMPTIKSKRKVLYWKSNAANN